MKKTFIKREKVALTSSDKSLTGGIAYCSEHQGKMVGIDSLSSSCLANPICQKRRTIDGSVCQGCFAAAMMEGMYRHTMPEVYAENYRILTTGLIDYDSIPIFPTILGRIESFGDTANWIQAANYIQVIRKNPLTHFGWWSKNINFIEEAIRNGYELPDNVQIVQSSMMLNVPEAPKADFVSKVFTVYTADYLEEHPEVNINCGTRTCIACKHCYVDNPDGVSVEYINEIYR